MFALRRVFCGQTRLMAIRSPVATMSYTGDKLTDKERGDEKAYFSKKDAKLLAALAEKMAARGELNSQKKEEHDAACDDLDSIFADHGLDKKANGLLYQELMEWKRHDH